MKVRFTVLMLVALAVGVLAPTAHAGLFTLTLDDVTTQVTVIDNMAGDTNPLLGVITFSGAIDGWAVNVTTGISKPVFPGLPKMDLNSVNVSSGGAGMLTIILTDRDFALPGSMGGEGLLISSIGGTTDGTVVLDQILDPDNTEYGFSDPDPSNNVVVPLGPFGPGAFAGSNAGVFSDLDLFSITEKAVITHGAGVMSTSFDAVSVVPVPGAILLGLLGLGAAGLKLRRFA